MLLAQREASSQPAPRSPLTFSLKSNSKSLHIAVVLDETTLDRQRHLANRVVRIFSTLANVNACVSDRANRYCNSAAFLDQSNVNTAPHPIR